MTEWLGTPVELSLSFHLFQLRVCPPSGGQCPEGDGLWGGEFPWARHTVDRAHSVCWWALGRMVRAQTSLPRGCFSFMVKTCKLIVLMDNLYFVAPASPLAAVEGWEELHWPLFLVLGSET